MLQKLGERKTDKNQIPFSLIIVAFVLLILPLLIHNEYIIHIFVMVFFFAFLGSSWNIVSGFTGELSLGHAALVGIGGYVSTLLFINAGLTPWIGMIVGAIVTVIAGIIIGYPCFKLRGPFFTLTTIAFAELLRIYVSNTETGPFGIQLKGSMGLLVPLLGNAPHFFEFSSKIPYYYIMLMAMFVATWITFLIRKKRLGHYLLAIKSDPDAAQALGVNLTKYRLIAMIISSAFASFGGVFYAQYFRYINAARIFGLDLSIEIALIALIGGQGTILGPIFGALLLVPVGEYLSLKLGGSLPGSDLAIYGLIMMAVVLFMPRGINNIVVKVFNNVDNFLMRLWRLKPREILNKKGRSP